MTATPRAASAGPVLLSCVVGLRRAVQIGTVVAGIRYLGVVVLGRQPRLGCLFASVTAESSKHPARSLSPGVACRGRNVVSTWQVARHGVATGRAVPVLPAL